MKLSKIIFAILIITNIIGVTFVAKNRYEEILANEQEILVSHAERLERAIESEIMVTEIVGEVIRINNGVIKEDDFYKLAEILSTSLVASSVAYIPDGTIKYLYPPEFSEGVVGNNVFESAKDAVDSKKARDTKEVVISGPYVLFEDTLGIVIRNPIYIGDTFWGIVTVAMDAEDLYEYAGLDVLERQGYAFELNTSQVLAKQSEDYSAEEAISRSISLGATSSWNFGLYVKDKTNIVASDVMFWFLMFLFLNFILYYCLQKIEQSKETLARKLNYDALTGADSRLKLQKFYEGAKNIPFALFFIDLNKFKPVNDTYGHKVGDKLLKAYVERLRNDLKADSILARIGGDEFVVVTPQVADYDLTDIIKKKLIHLSEVVFLIDSIEINISASIGCVLSSEADNLEALLAIADEKMYAEKGNKAR